VSVAATEFKKSAYCWFVIVVLDKVRLDGE
jgi:hypothetical protein